MTGGWWLTSLPRQRRGAPRAPGERQPAPRIVSLAVMELTAHIAFIPPGSAVPSLPVIQGGTPPGGGITASVGNRDTIVILSWYYRGTSVIPD